MSREPRLWVIDPSVQHAEDEGTAEITDRWPGSNRVFRPCIDGDGPSAESGYTTDAVVVMGSGASAHDDRPWLRSLSDWLRPIVTGRVDLPVLGICFGHQLIAHLAGANVGFIDGERTKRIGVGTTRVNGGRLLPGEHELKVVISHRETVEQLPAGYRLTASRTDSPYDGLEHEERKIYCFQFHPEARVEFAERAGIEPGRIDDRVRRDGARVIEAFVRNAVGPRV